jgi:hypothetical protein
MTPPSAHKWAFAPRFRRHAFGWRSQPAEQRVREAVAEIWKVAKKAPALAAAGAVQFLEKVSPALAQVDSSSGAIGTADLRVLDGRNTGHPLVAGPATLANRADPGSG